MERKLHEAAAQLPEASLEFSRIEKTARLCSKKTNRRFIRVAIAACFALLLCIGIGSHAYQAEAREYEAAVAFFAENGLSTEGLTRAEVKAVYRDITTKSFTYSKTGQVIQSSLTQEQIAGFEILQQEPTPEDVENLWNYKNHGEWFVPYVKPDYQYGSEPIWDADGLAREFRYYIEKYTDGEAVWQVELPFGYGEHLEVADGVIVWGDDLERISDTLYRYSWIGKIDQSGNLLWIQQLQNGYNEEYAHAVLENADGSYTLFSRGDNKILCVSCYSPDGVRTLYKETDLGTHGVGLVAHYQGGYLVQVSPQGENESARFIRVDRQGNVTEGFAYSNRDGNYVWRDMVEFGGKVYISAYKTPKIGGDEEFFGRTEIARILDFCFGKWEESTDGSWGVSNEELTPVVRENYTAVLLVCDPADHGKMQTFYTVSGSLGADLIITEDNRLIWETESITDTFFSPGTSSFTIGGQCYVYQYSFGPEGNLITLGRTDRVTNFRR